MPELETISMARSFSRFPNLNRDFTVTARLILAFFFASFLAGIGSGQQATVKLVDGMVLGPGRDSSVQYIVPPQANTNPNPVAKASTIVVLDDGLRRTYVNVGRCDPAVQVKDNSIKINLGNMIAKSAPQVPSGPIIDCSPFTAFGRRVCFIRSQDATIPIVQGITEITTNYLRVEGLKGVKGEYDWDMRLSLNSLNGRDLREILVQNASPTRSKDWLEIVNLFISAERFVEARQILVEAILKFPELENTKSELKSLDQNVADQLFEAAEIAKDAGQFQFSKLILVNTLESIKRAGLSIETQLKADAKLKAIAGGQKDRDELLTWMTEDVSKVSDVGAKNELQSLLAEIAANLTADTALRFTDYRRRRADTTLKPDQLAALAISGWIFGPTAGKDNASVVASGVKARRLITEYLSKPLRDDQIVQEITRLEAGTPDMVAKIIANMAPPLPTPESAAVSISINPSDSSQPPVQSTIAGRFAIDVPLSGDMAGKSAKYTVQLPPEYNPFRRYPCVFTLPGESTNMEWQIAWWAGQYSPESKRCFGEASKRGYIVVSPDWAEPKQPSYNFTENEHAMILAPLRDAMRRFSIDSDRVFLSGHFMGGDAAWDIALAHPDLWAGCVVIGGEARNYVIQYGSTAEYVPTYFVAGELDNFVNTNAKEWEKMMGRRQIDCLVTLYQGRKPDHFQEELPRIMNWMSFPARVRTPFPKNFTTTTLRAGDRFFWWFETKELFKAKLVHPLLYSNKPGPGYLISSTINKQTNTVSMEAVPANTFSIWLSPEMVDFEKQITLLIKGNRERREPKPETRVILEDVRGRADRKHPFWMRVDLPK